MSLPNERIQELVKEFGKSEKDTGAPEVQVALLTEQIRNLTEHFKVHSKDHHGRRGLIAMVSNRRKLLKYIKRQKLSNYQELIKKLGLRR